MKKIKYILAVMLFFWSHSLLAIQEVPFEVSKTKMVAEFTGNAHEVFVSNGTVYDLGSCSPDGIFPDLPKKCPEELYGQETEVADPRVRIRDVTVRYRLEFWNVGEMGGEKGFIFKSNYGDAKLTIDFEPGYSRKWVKVKENKRNALLGYREKAAKAPSINRIVFNLRFTGGPYGKFYLKDKQNSALLHQSRVGEILVGQLVNGNYVQLNRFGMKAQIPKEVRMLLENKYGFEKWLEILNNGDCDDSFIRFNDYNGEVMVGRDLDDMDSWNIAEIDMVICDGDMVYTGDDSTASLAIEDMLTWKLKPNSIVLLSKPVVGKRLAFKTLKGRFWANVKSMAKYGTLDIEMTQAVAGIKGTTFVLEDNGTESKLKVIDGEVEFKSKKTGKKEMVKAGEESSVTKDGFKKKQTFNLEEEKKVWTEFDKKNKTKKTKKTNKTRKKDKESSIFNYVILIGLVGGILFWFLKRRRKTKNN